MIKFAQNERFLMKPTKEAAIQIKVWPNYLDSEMALHNFVPGFVDYAYTATAKNGQYFVLL